MDDREQYINFDEYIRQGESQKRERADAWRVAIGLQAVDGLKTSEYLQETARRNIEGEITIDEARELVKQYYIKKTSHDKDDEDKEEADRVSSNISKLLQTDAQDWLPFIVPSLKECLSMLAVSAIMTSRRKSGYCEMILCSTDAGKIFV